MLSGNTVESYRSLLSDTESDRYEKLRFERDRHEYLLTRVLVRTTLSHYLPVKHEEWYFTYGPFGKPQIEPSYKLQFNLTNTPWLVACLISRCGEVGVDAEPWRRAKDILEIAKDIFSPFELRQLYSLPLALWEDRALSLWTLEESYVKARGVGINFPLKKFSFLFDFSGISLKFDDKLNNEAKCWQFEVFDYERHKIAMMVESSSTVGIRKFYPDLQIIQN